MYAIRSYYAFVRGVVRTDGVEARDVALDAVALAAHLVCLAGHVGGVDQRQPLAVGGRDVPVRHVEPGAGPRLFGHRDVDAAMLGVPATVGDVLLVV